MSEQLPPSDDAGDEIVDKPVDDVRAAETHADAWATAAAEDLEAERARRSAQYRPPPDSAAAELKKLEEREVEFYLDAPGVPLKERTTLKRELIRLRNGIQSVWTKVNCHAFHIK